MAGCHEAAPPAPDPQAVLNAIPSADAAKYERIEDMKGWRNPYLIVRSDGVALYDSADSAEILLQPEELLAALAKLPASDWPYGRVVAAQENTARASAADGVSLRRMKGIIGGELGNAHIAVKWVASP
jgi:hypothetical protein